jgi:hypothetical protein
MISGASLPGQVVLEFGDPCVICCCSDSEEILNIMCENRIVESKCPGTRIHDNCLKSWIQSRPPPFICLNCHSNSLVIPHRYNQEIIDAISRRTITTIRIDYPWNQFCTLFHTIVSIIVGTVIIGALIYIFL